MPTTVAGSDVTYRAFISYSHQDEAWGRWLHRVLETYRVPRRLVGTEAAHGTIPRRLNPIFRDRDELASAPELGATINAALAASENLVVICSPAAAASHWVNEEVLAYRRMGRGDRILCLIVDGEPNATDLPGRASRECFCPALRFALDADGALADVPTEPIAADARAGRDGRSDAKLKLIAGILGAGFDALKQREQHRRMQRLAAVTTGALAMMVVTAALAAYALVARQHAVSAERAAVTAQHDAVAARKVAERRQAQAEGLVDFMIGDLSTKLQAESRSDILLNVDDRVMAYLKGLPPTDVNDAALIQRTATLEEIGATELNQGRPNQALAAFDAAIAIASRLATAAPESAARQVAYSRVLSYAGIVHQHQKQMAAARRNYAAARQVLSASLARDPDNLDVVRQLSYCENNLGHLLLDSGQRQAARAKFEAFLQLSRRFAASPKDAQNYLQAATAAHHSLGSVDLQLGDLAGAAAEYQAATTLWERLGGSLPDNNVIRGETVLKYQDLGNLQISLGNVRGGMRSLSQALAMARASLAVDPEVDSLRRREGELLATLARAQDRAGHTGPARASMHQAITILAAQVKAHPHAAEAQLALLRARLQHAAQLRDDGRRADAHTEVAAAAAALTPLLAQQPDNAELIRLEAVAMLTMAGVATDRGTATTLRVQALQMLDARGRDQSDPLLAALRVEALLQSGRKADAQPLIQRLWASGYRDPGFVGQLRQYGIAYAANSAFAAGLHTAIAQAIAGDRAAIAAVSGNAAGPQARR